MSKPEPLTALTRRLLMKGTPGRVEADITEMFPWLTSVSAATSRPGHAVVVARAWRCDRRVLRKMIDREIQRGDIMPAVVHTEVRVYRGAP